MRTIRSLGVKKIHKVAPFVCFMNIFNPLHNQIGAGANPPNSQKNVVGQEIRCQPLHKAEKQLRKAFPSITTLS